MNDEHKPPRFRRPSELRDDEVVEVESAERVALPPAPRAEPFTKIARGQTEMMHEVLAVQRKMALQLDGFGQLMNRRFDLFHEELSMLRATVLANHEPRLGKVESSLAQKMGKGARIGAVILVAAPLLADALPKYRSVIEAVAGVFQ